MTKAQKVSSATFMFLVVGVKVKLLHKCPKHNLFPSQPLLRPVDQTLTNFLRSQPGQDASTAWQRRTLSCAHRTKLDMQCIAVLCCAVLCCAVLCCSQS
jgi:hypothetical protein